MSSFTPRVWKSRPERTAESTAGKFRAHTHVKFHNLPIARTAFIGRRHDVTGVKELLNEHRLVTLSGSGGVGKTRLALEIGAELFNRYVDGVWFVDLAPIADPELVSSVVAKAIGMTQQPDRRVDEAIPDWLQRKKLLLILDNCEHVVDTVAAIAAAILQTAPDVRILATSRQTLAIAGETVHRLPSLSNDEAVALFVDRARAADTRFALTENTAPIVADICRHLDGIPLAIELAAARVKVLSVPHLAQRLDERFKILTGGSRDALPRQKTLASLIDWSYGLLTPQEQLLFARLGIFAGGFGLDAATRVCGGDGLDEIDVLDLLGSLTDKSLIVADTGGERERYRLLESIGAFALEKLAASGQREGLARRHAVYFRAQAEASGLAAHELEVDNFRSALEWALTQRNDPPLGGALVGALQDLWSYGGLAVEGRYWVRLALEELREQDYPRIVAGLRLVRGLLLSGRSKYDETEAALRLYAAADDRRGVARSKQQLAFALFQMARIDEARAEIEQALVLARECGDKITVANCLNQQAIFAWSSGDVGRARETFAQALAAFREFPPGHGTAFVLGSLAELEFAQGNPEQALRYSEEALALALGGKHNVKIAADHLNSAAYRIALGDIAGARESALEGLRMARSVQEPLQIAIALGHFAVLAALDGDRPLGARLTGYVDAKYAQLGMQREYTERWAHDTVLRTLRETLSEDEIATLAAEGASWAEDRAVEEALREE